MRKVIAATGAFIVFLLAFTGDSMSQTRIAKVFRCGGKRIENGDTTYAVLKKCGEPAFKELLSAEGCERVEKWHYDCYGRGYVEELIFRNGVLVERNRGEDSRGTQACGEPENGGKGE